MTRQGAKPRRASGRAVRVIRMLVLLLLPTPAARVVVKFLGYRLDRGAHVGWSMILVDRLEMGTGSRIGHLNLIDGRYTLRLDSDAAIGHMNLFTGSYAEGNEPVVLSLGEGSKITARHTVDATNSITVGKFATIAGHGSQLWTHGYVQPPGGRRRYRVDGPIDIGDNVNVGSGSIISAGVQLASDVMIGTGSAVVKSLLEPGFYVSSPLRIVRYPADPESREDLQRIPSVSGDIVYIKRGNAPD